ncbi:nucleoside phosphorylase domain-containing protein [Aspergillus crustosus]
MSDPRHYTIGWVCAVRVEFVAAQQLLERKYGQPRTIHPSDQNGYALGSISGHNVVIATLPQAEYGVPSAARVAANMVASFPNVRFGLMVGIGGGAPSRKFDIRLGDLVISMPGGSDHGALEYVLENTARGRTTRVVRKLDPPPMMLRNAVGALHGKYGKDRNQIHHTIDGVIARVPRMRGEFARPHPSRDRLFKSNVVYNPRRPVQASDLVPRRTRAPHESPAIYYGTIASANTLMKDATLRDNLIAERNVLCFEMEAAGLMNHFPCIIIRGICDYSDTSKNDDWQGYAAIVAAAYAKDLLKVIAPKDVLAERTIQEVTGVRPFR